MTAGLEVRDLAVVVGGYPAVWDVSFDVAEGSIVGLVGPNGAGKTTVVDAITGMVPADGTVRLSGRPVHHLPPHERAALGMARTFQSLELFEDLTVGENLAVAAESGGRERGGADASVARAAGLAGVDDVVELLPSVLAHDRRKQVALARALAGRPGVLLLDEPAAGLDRAERTSLATVLRTLAGEGVAVLVVDHDVGLVLDVCEKVAVMDAGRIVAEGSPARVRSDPVVAAAWLGPPGAPAPASRAPRSPRSAAPGGPPVLELAGLTAGHGGVAAVVGVDLVVRPGEVVALLGANGAGKTTTLLAASGALRPLAGEVRVLGEPGGRRRERMPRRGVAHAAQDRGVLRTLTVSEQLRLAAAAAVPAAGGGGGASDRRRGAGRRSTRTQQAAAVAAVVDQVPALAPLLERPGALLSGGEHQLLSVARALVARPRLLLVDELSLGLAPPAVSELLGVVRSAADAGAGVLLVEQFAPLALSIADRAYVLDRGRVVAAGRAEEIADRPELLESAYLGSPPSASSTPDSGGGGQA